MRARTVDFHAVEPHHAEIHERLNNWRDWVTVRGVHWMSPIWKMGKSNGRQWDVPILKAAVDTLDALAIERAVSKLPDKQRGALRWSYVYRSPPSRACRELAVSMEGLEALVRTGRTMLVNRLKIGPT